MKVLITETGDTFHHVAQSHMDVEVEEVEVFEALAEGYPPCGICYY